MVQVVPAVPVAGPRNSREAFQEPADESAACGWLTTPPNIKPLPMPRMLNIPDQFRYIMTYWEYLIIFGVVEFNMRGRGLVGNEWNTLNLSVLVGNKGIYSLYNPHILYPLFPN